jgi:non-homologous end joining protein Ku
VPRESINRLYWDIPNHLSPGGKTGIEAFAVIREALLKARTKFEKRLTHFVTLGMFRH